MIHVRLWKMSFLEFWWIEVNGRIKPISHFAFSSSLSLRCFVLRIGKSSTASSEFRGRTKSTSITVFKTFSLNGYLGLLHHLWWTHNWLVRLGNVHCLSFSRRLYRCFISWLLVSIWCSIQIKIWSMLQRWCAQHIFVFSLQSPSLQVVIVNLFSSISFLTMSINVFTL